MEDSSLHAVQSRSDYRQIHNRNVFEMIDSVCCMAYAYAMQDVMAALKDRRAKAEAKLVRATKALETARKELLDIDAAERVFATITGVSILPQALPGTGSERDKAMTRLLGTSSTEAHSPAELHPIYIAETNDTINLDAFRTALWRLQKKVVTGNEKDWIVRSDGGRYWRESFSKSTDDFDCLLLDSEEDTETN